MLAGCPGVAPVSPAEVAAAQAAALARSDVAEAARWLSEDAVRQAVPWPAPEGVPAGPARERAREARWTGAEGPPVVVVRGQAGWRIRSGVLGLTRASTPQEALETFARALAARDYGTLLGLLPEAERRHWTAARLAAVLDAGPRAAAWAALATALAAAPPSLSWLDEGLRARAVMEVGEGKTTILLIREEQAWKILDVLPTTTYTPAP